MYMTAVSTIEVAEGSRKAAGVLLQHHKHACLFREAFPIYTPDHACSIVCLGKSRGFFP